MKKVLIFIIFVLIALLSSCAGEDKNTSETGSPETEQAETTSVLDARLSVSDEITDELDFKGVIFNIVTQKMHDKDIISEGETGDLLNDAIFGRNIKIEQRYNIVIKTIPDTYDNNNIFIEKSVMAGDHAFDLINGQAVATCSVVQKELLMPWQGIQYINFDKPWWSASTLNDLTVKNKTYLAIGDFALSALYSTYCMYYDKVEAEKYNIPDMYEIIKSGKWTLDKLYEITQGVYNDLNGNSQKDIDDYFGFSSDPNSNADAYLWAFDNPVMKKDSDGIPRLSIKTEKIIVIFDKLHTLFFDSPGSYVDFKYKGRWGYSAGLGEDMFKAGKALFANAGIGSSISMFRDYEHDYGIIPYPKFDENQKNYMTMSDGSHAVLGVPLTAENPEMVGAVTETLCAETWKTVIPVYYDIALKVKGARDEQSIEMLDMITQSRVFDFGYIYDNWQGMSFCIEVVMSQNGNFESYYAANEQRVLKHYNDIIEIFIK